MPTVNNVFRGRSPNLHADFKVVIVTAFVRCRHFSPFIAHVVVLIQELKVANGHLEASISRKDIANRAMPTKFKLIMCSNNVQSLGAW